jgi:hypothetical protein
LEKTLGCFFLFLLTFRDFKSTPLRKVIAEVREEAQLRIVREGIVYVLGIANGTANIAGFAE